MGETSRVLSETEQNALLEQPNTQYSVELRNLLFLQLSLNHDLRLSEQLSLKWDQVNLSTGKVTVNGSQAVNDRTIHLSDQLQQVLTEWRERQKDEWRKRNVGPYSTQKKPDYVYTTLDGTRLSEAYIRRMVSGYADDANIEGDVSINSLRKTFARNQ